MCRFKAQTTKKTVFLTALVPLDLGPPSTAAVVMAMGEGRAGGGLGSSVTSVLRPDLPLPT